MRALFPFLPISPSLSLSVSVAISRAPSAKMKEIFIGFCSDFKWICGSILNGKVRQQLQPQNQQQQNNNSSSINGSHPPSLYSAPLSDPCLVVISILFKFVCLFLLMRNYENLFRCRRLSLECFRQFGVVIIAFLCSKCIRRVYQAICGVYMQLLCILRAICVCRWKKCVKMSEGKSLALICLDLVDNYISNINKYWFHNYVIIL